MAIPVLPVVTVLIALIPKFSHILCTSERIFKKSAAGITGLVFYFLATVFFYRKSLSILASNLTSIPVSALHPMLFHLNGLIPKPPYRFCHRHVSHMRLDRFHRLVSEMTSTVFVVGASDSSVRMHRCYLPN